MGRGMEQTLFKKGFTSSAVHPAVCHESKSDRWARVYIIKLMLDPPPRVPPDGTMGSRPASCSALLPL